MRLKFSNSNTKGIPVCMFLRYDSCNQTKRVWFDVFDVRGNRASQTRRCEMSVQIIADSACDLPLSVAETHGIDVMPMPYTFKGEVCIDDLGISTNFDDFYTAMRSGEKATTSQVPLGTAYDAIERAYAAGNEALLISLSSELSGTYASDTLAREQFLAAHPDASVHVVDSKCASTGEGLLVMAAAERAASGMSAAEIAAWAEANRLRINHLFTVGTFEHLVRGGRVSPAVGAAGTILNIKPVMRVDDLGRLVSYKKPRGRHKALETIADLTAERIEDPALQTIAIGHGHWPEYAGELKRLILERITPKDIMDARVGCIIGAHTGPEVLAVYFWGKEREPYKD